jgi:hypothetical protein
LRAGVLTEGADGDAVRVAAGEVLDKDVCGVRFQGDAVIAVGYGAVCYGHVGAAVDVPSIC